MQPMTQKEFEEFVGKQRWIFAKTYAHKSPHEYCVLKYLVGAPEDMVRAAIFIRDHGFKIWFWKKCFTVFHLDGHLYWTMDDPIENTDLINRNNLRDYELSLKVVKTYDKYEKGQTKTYGNDVYEQLSFQWGD